MTNLRKLAERLVDELLSCDIDDAFEHILREELDGGEQAGEATSDPAAVSGSGTDVTAAPAAPDPHELDLDHLRGECRVCGEEPEHPIHDVVQLWGPYYGEHDPLLIAHDRIEKLERELARERGENQKIEE